MRTKLEAMDAPEAVSGQLNRLRMRTVSGESDGFIEKFEGPSPVPTEASRRPGPMPGKNPPACHGGAINWWFNEWHWATLGPNRTLKTHD